MAFTAPVDEVDAVSLAALDGILGDAPTADTVAAVEQPIPDDAPRVSQRRPRAAPKRRCKRRADATVH